MLNNYRLVFIALVVLLQSLTIHVSALDQQCYNVANHFKNKQPPINSFSLNPIPGNTLKDCTCQWTCCTRQSEKFLHDKVLSDLASIGPNETDIMYHHLSTFIHQFHAHIRKNIDNAEKFMNTIYSVAYPDLYPSNKDIFTQFYASIRQYMNGNLNHLEEPLKEIYMELVIRGYNYKNIKFDFNPKVRNCVKQLLGTDTTMPGSPGTFIQKTKRVMDKTRGVLAILDKLRQEIPSLSQLTANARCDRAVVNMQVCSICAAFSVPPCNRYCRHVLSKCYYDQVYLTKIFHDISINLKSLIEQISSHYNMKEALAELTKEISIFVSTLDLSPTLISNPVNEKCGKLQSSRQRRSVNDDFVIDGISTDQVHQRNKKSTSNNFKSSNIKNNRNDKAYEKFLQNLSNVLESGQFLWEKVIDRTCVHHFTAKAATQCWNGTSVGSFTSLSIAGWDTQISIESTYKADRLIKLMEITIKGIQNKPVEYPQLVMQDTTPSSGFSGSGSPDDEGKDDDDNGGVSGSGEGMISGSGGTAIPEDKGEGGTSAATSDNTPTITFRPLTVGSSNIPTSQGQTLPVTTPSISTTSDSKSSQGTTQTPTSKSTPSTSSLVETVKTTPRSDGLQEDPTTTSHAVAIHYYSTLAMVLFSSLVYTLMESWLL